MSEDFRALKEQLANLLIDPRSNELWLRWESPEVVVLSALPKRKRAPSAGKYRDQILTGQSAGFFVGADFFGTVFDGNWSGACFVDADMHDVALAPDKLVPFNGANFSGAILGGELPGMQARGAGGAETWFADLNMPRSQWPGSILPGSRFIDVNCPESSFEGADLSDTVWINSNAARTDFTRADTGGAFFIDVNLSWTSWRGTFCKDTIMIDCTLEGVEGLDYGQAIVVENE